MAHGWWILPYHFHLPLRHQARPPGKKQAAPRGAACPHLQFRRSRRYIFGVVTVVDSTFLTEYVAVPSDSSYNASVAPPPSMVVLPSYNTIVSLPSPATIVVRALARSPALSASAHVTVPSCWTVGIGIAAVL